MSAQLYHADPYRTMVTTTVAFSFAEEGKTHVALAESVFYPKGGGQKGDRGTLDFGDRTLKVIDTLKDPESNTGAALLIVENDGAPITDGASVTASIDWDFRWKQMRLHSALHLHHCMLERVSGAKIAYPKMADVRDGEALSVYDGDALSDDLLNQAEAAFFQAIKDGAEIKLYDDAEKAGYRWWEALEFKIPCGGTHPHDLSEIGALAITVSRKKGETRIKLVLA